VSGLTVLHPSDALEADWNHGKDQTEGHGGEEEDSSSGQQRLETEGGRSGTDPCVEGQADHEEIEAVDRPVEGRLPGALAAVQDFPSRFLATPTQDGIPSQGLRRQTSPESRHPRRKGRHGDQALVGQGQIRNTAIP